MTAVSATPPVTLKKATREALKGLLAPGHLRASSVSCATALVKTMWMPAGAKLASPVDKSSALCGTCHIRGEADTIPAKGGFIRHHEQYNELLASPHKSFDCVTCHDPHKKAEFAIKADCTTCHSNINTEFTGSEMQETGVTCTDCHMPMATKSATALGPYKGDVKTHVFRINTDPSASMFTEDGGFAKDFVTLDFACLSCHQDEDVQWPVNTLRVSTV